MKNRYYEDMNKSFAINDSEIYKFMANYMRMKQSINDGEFVDPSTERIMKDIYKLIIRTIRQAKGIKNAISLALSKDKYFVIVRVYAYELKDDEHEIWQTVHLDEDKQLRYLEVEV